VILRVNETTFDLSKQPLLIGVVDFSLSTRGGALTRARRLVEEGAGLIEIGVLFSPEKASSSTLSEAELLAGFADEWRSAGTGVPLSVKVRYPLGVGVLLKRGVDMVHDCTGVFSREEIALCGSLKAALVLGPLFAPGEEGAKSLEGLFDFKERALFAASVGIPSECLCLAPGSSLGVYAKLEELLALGHPLFVSAIPEASSVERSEARAVACVVQGFLRGARGFRVQHVRAARAAVRMMEALTVKAFPQVGFR